ncbi:peptidylprolyl isomerase fpr4 [Linnemannia zychae]|nr:peptidylprolyl isomerase fpr4 [Linnemannia zychae]
MILGFWGLTVLPDKTYTQIVDSSFKVSMAALDEVTKPGRTSLRVSVNNKSQVLCSLIPGKIEQQKLDVAFAEGEEITFSVTGDNAIHLSGNYLPDTNGAGDDEEDYEEEEEDVYDRYDRDEDGNIVISEGTKRLADLIGDEDEDEDSEDDPDFTGDDDEDEDDSDDDDDEDNAAAYVGQAEDDEDEDDEEEDDEEENDEEEEAEEEVEEEEAEEEEDSDNDEIEENEDDDGDSDEDEDSEPEPVKVEAPAAKKQKISEEKAFPIKSHQEDIKKGESKKANKKTLPNGLIIEDTRVGEGARAKSGKKVGMRYIGRLENGKVFDKNTSGKPFTFKLGAGEVIKGWDLGIQGMQLGGQRHLTIPPTLAYGSQGAPPDIPRNATLIFEVKLVSLK